jgi:hypothetical protein
MWSGLHPSNSYQTLQIRLLQMDWQTEQGEITRLTANSHLVVVSRHAITEQDQVLVASAAGSQSGLYV